ncbi:hypothetical protein [Spiroplasma endosymbiont of Diplazon laetatorius]|uniref:hypothetical protein n=1 Tax=Spiroplasma endosymbiont of Diplazon laetatorius TaxID=3066322 RepID=UPI0030CFBF71
MKKIISLLSVFGLITNVSVASTSCRVISTPGEDAEKMSKEKRIEKINYLFSIQKSVEHLINTIKDGEPEAAGYDWWTKRNEVLIEIYKFDKGENLVEDVKGIRREEVIQNVKMDKAIETLKEFGIKDQSVIETINQRIKEYWNVL